MIGLVTCYFQHNYGSQLQALATQMAMEKLGVEHETIRIDGLKPEINRAKYKYFLSRMFDLQTVKDKMATVRKVYAKKTNGAYAANLALRDGLFTAFAEGRFRLSRRYDTKKELGANGAYDTFIVGSDQLWLPSNIAADYYTLNFVPDGVRKIAYATSFGVTSLPKKYAEKAKTFLGRFNSIMLRESSGQKLVKSLTGMDVPLVLDPTMLFDKNEWNTLLSEQKRQEKPYILCYFLGNNEKCRNFARCLASETGRDIVQLPHLDEYVKKDEGFADVALYDVNPLDFVSLIRDADWVLTDSFHCTVFSMLFGKCFFTFRRYSDDGTASTNSRLYSLLDMFGMGGRMLTGDEPVMECLKMDYDVDGLHALIEEKRTKSLKLLKDAIGIC